MEEVRNLNIAYIINKYGDNDEFKGELKTIIEKFLDDKLDLNCLRYFFIKNSKMQLSDSDELLEEISKYKSKKCKSMINYKNNELVSIIITTFNRINLLEEAINSLLNQTYKNIEIIIIDDASTDKTKDIINKKYINSNKIVYYRNIVNKGPGESRRKAYKSFARGEYIIFMDDDDLLLDINYIAKAVEIHKKNKQISFIGANAFIENCEWNRVQLADLNISGYIDKREYFLNFQSLQYPKPLSTFTAIFKKNVLENMKFYEMKMMNDTSIYLRALLNGDAIIMDDIVGVYRIHGNNISFSCDTKFIIENLEEKCKIGNMAIESEDYTKEEIEKWTYEQVYSTICYYIKNSNVKLIDYIKLIKWYKMKGIYNYSVLRNVLMKSYIKSQICWGEK